MRTINKAALIVLVVSGLIVECARRGMSRAGPPPIPIVLPLWRGKKRGELKKPGILKSKPGFYYLGNSFREYAFSEMNIG
jgi:hypothetical protein